MSTTVQEKSKLFVPSQSPPKTSVNRWRAFYELARVHKPAGVLAFHIPLLLGSLVSVDTEVPRPEFLDGAIFFVQLFLSSFVLRSAACVWNDAADYKFDSQVARTRTRPIPSGAATPAAARVFAVALIFLWVGIVWQASGDQALYTLIPNFLFNVAYPFAKRVTDYPQLFLGLMFSWNVLTGYMMTTRYDMIEALQMPQIQQSLGYLAVANVAWTVLYDTIYAYQDIADDEKAGVRSLALKWKSYGKLALSILAGIEVGSLVAAGIAIDAGPWYFSFSCLGSAMVAAVGLITLDLTNPENCGLWFKRHLLYGGITMCTGFVVEYVQKL